MPRRTNAFQKLVYLAKLHLADGATVTESKMLRNVDTEAETEVDVCIEGICGGQPVTICIECVDRSRPVGPGWVNEMRGKHEGLPTHKLILASRKGFSKPALQLARKKNITTVHLDELDKTDCPDVGLLGVSFWTKSVDLKVTRVNVRVSATRDLPSEVVRAEPDLAVFSSERNVSGPISTLVNSIIRSEQINKQLMADATEEHHFFTVSADPPMDHHGNALFLEQSDSKVHREIERLDIVGECRFKIQQFSIKATKLDDTVVEWSEIIIGEHPAMIVASRDSAGKSKVSISLMDEKMRVKVFGRFAIQSGQLGVEIFPGEDR